MSGVLVVTATDSGAMNAINKNESSKEFLKIALKQFLAHLTIPRLPTLEPNEMLGAIKQIRNHI